MQTVHTIQKLGSPENTGAHMMRIVKSYANDIGEMAKWPLPRFYNYVKNLPYLADPKGNEVLARPKWTLSKDWAFRDCDDKAILIGSWLYLNKVPFKFRASSSRKDGALHHVYTVAQINGKEIVLDATYSKNELGKEVPTTYKRDLDMNFLHTFEGENSTLGFSLKDLKRKATKATKSVKTLKRKASNLKRQASKIPVIKQALNNPALKNALVSAIPGGAAILAATRAAKAALNVAKGANVAPANAAAQSAAAAERASKAAIEAANLAKTATPAQKVVYAQAARENADLAKQAALETAKHEGKAIELNGAFFGAADYTTGASAAARSAMEAANSVNEDSTTTEAKSLPKYAIPAGIAVAGLAFLLLKKKK